MERLLTASEFKHAVEFLRITEPNKKAAFRHMVQGVPVKIIAEDMDCSRQNIEGLVKRVYAGFTRHEEALKRMNS